MWKNKSLPFRDKLSPGKIIAVQRAGKPQEQKSQLCQIQF